RGGRGEFCAELLCLEEGATHQLGTGDAGGEAKVILDPHGGAGLAAWPSAVEHERAQALRCAVDRGRQTRRPGPDHDQVVALLSQRAFEPDRLCELSDRWIAQARKVSPHHYRHVLVAERE